MTAALVIEPRERTEARELAAVRAEPNIIALARNGDAGALADLFDKTVIKVYGYAFNATRKAIEAERVTDAVVTRLPRLLRRQRWDSLDAFEAQLMLIARAEVAGFNRRQQRNEQRRQLRAWTRHAVLAAAAFATVIYTGVTVL